ncbi:MAG: isoprenylcysteine carboxylmethyltransferase family protein [Pseudomonadota bacterium]
MIEHIKTILRSSESSPKVKRLAVLYGFACHGIFGLAGLAMLVQLHQGMTLGFGPFEGVWAVVANALLLAQFPLAHSLLLTPRGNRLLARLAPEPHGKTLATTTYALIASLQLLLLFTLWSPSGIVFFRLEGAAMVAITLLYLAAWGLLTKASFDAGPEVQSGFLGWSSLWRGIKPKFPPMPQTGLFKIVRQPIYVSFALVLWLVPVWTPDQLILAVTYTAYCILAPLHKERRFARMFGPQFEAYRAHVPYWVPGLRLAQKKTPAQGGGFENHSDKDAA